MFKKKDKSAAKAAAKKNKSEAQIPVAPPPADPVQSQASAMEPTQETTEDKNMQLTLKGLDKRGRNAIYTGAAVALRFPIGAFPDKQAPQAINVAEGQLAGPKEKKAALTPEERKAARAAQPKLTLAEKVARAEQRTAALKAKLEAQAQPAL